MVYFYIIEKQLNRILNLRIYGSVIRGYNSPDSIDALQINIDYLASSLLLFRRAVHIQYYVY